jgi:uncharacterized protein (DUF2384 family)
MVATEEPVDLQHLLNAATVASVAVRRSSEGVPDEVAVLLKDLTNELRVNASALRCADPDQVIRLLSATVQVEEALRSETQHLSIRIPLEIMRSALVDMVEDRPVSADLPVGEVLHNLVDMANVPQADLADLLGVAPRTLQRWLTATGARVPSGDDDARIRVVAQVVNQLRHSFTGPGGVKWFYRKHPVLGVAPVKWLGDSKRYPQLLSVARRSRFAP